MDQSDFKNAKALGHLTELYEMALSSQASALKEIDLALVESLHIGSEMNNEPGSGLLEAELAIRRGFFPARTRVLESLLALSEEYGGFGQRVCFGTGLPEFENPVKWISSVELSGQDQDYRVVKHFEDGSSSTAEFELERSGWDERNWFGTSLEELPREVDPLLAMLPRNGTLPAEVSLFIQDRLGYLRAFPLWDDHDDVQAHAVWEEQGSFVKSIREGNFEWRIYPQGVVVKTGRLIYREDYSLGVEPLAVWEAMDLSSHVLSVSDTTSLRKLINQFASVVPGVNEFSDDDVYSSFPSFEYSLAFHPAQHS